jgi:hypothetical protein
MEAKDSTEEIVATPSMEEAALSVRTAWAASRVEAPVMLEEASRVEAPVMLEEASMVEAVEAASMAEAAVTAEH